MGDDIFQYRARIGTFKSYRVCHTSKVSHCCRRTISLDISDVILFVFGVIEFIRILLVIHGVEQNPGPSFPQQQKQDDYNGDTETTEPFRRNQSHESVPERNASTYSSQHSKEEIGSVYQQPLVSALSDDLSNTTPPLNDLKSTPEEEKRIVQEIEKSDAACYIPDIESKEFITTEVPEEQNQDEAQCMIDNAPKIIERSGISKVIKCLKENKLAIITGLSGEGKTSVAIEVLKRLQAGYEGMTPLKPILINSPDQWNQVLDKKCRCIVFIDDIFGKSHLNRDSLTQWMPLMEKHKSMSTALWDGSVLIIITSRNDIYQEAVRRRHSRGSVLSDKVVINLTEDFPLSYDEKNRMLIEKGLKHDRKINEIIRMPPNPLYGFPLLCQFMHILIEQSTVKQSKDLDTVFRDPMVFLSKDLQRIRAKEQVKYFTLVYCLLQDNQTVNTEQLHPLKQINEEIRQNMSSIAAVCCFKSNDLVSELREALKSMSGFYVSERDFEFSFHHQSIIEAVCFEFGKDNPEMFLQRCSESFIMEMVCLEDDEMQDSNKLVIPVHCYQLLAQRIAECVQKRPKLNSFLHLSSRCFVKVLFSYLKEIQFFPSDLLFYCCDSVNHISEFYGSDLYEIYVAKYGKALYFQEVICSVQKQIANGSVSTCKLLLEKGGYVTLSDLLAASHKHADMARFLLSLHTIFTEYDMLKVLKEACKNGNSELVQHFVNKGLEPDECCVHLALESDSTETLALVLQDGTCSKELLNELLVKAYIENVNTNILEYLVSLGAVHTLACFSGCLGWHNLHLSRPINSKSESRFTNPIKYLFSLTWSKRDIEKSLLEPFPLRIRRIPEELVDYLQKMDFTFDERLLSEACLNGWEHLPQFILSQSNFTPENLSIVIDNLLCKATFYTKCDKKYVCAKLKMLFDAGCSFTSEHLLKSVENGWSESLKLMLSLQKWERNNLISVINEASQTADGSLIAILVDYCGHVSHESLLISIRFRNPPLVKYFLNLKCWGEDHLRKAGEELYLMLNSKEDTYISSSNTLIERTAVILNEIFKCKKFQNDTFSHILEYLIKRPDCAIRIKGKQFLQCCKDLCIVNDQRIIKIAALHNEHEFVRSHIKMLTQDQRDEIPSYLLENLHGISGYADDGNGSSSSLPLHSPSIDMLKCLTDARCNFQIRFLEENINNRAVVHFLLSENVFPNNILRKSMMRVIVIACICHEHDFVKSVIHLLTQDQLNEIPSCLSDQLHEMYHADKWNEQPSDLQDSITEVLNRVRDAGCQFQLTFLVNSVKRGHYPVVNFLISENVFPRKLLHKDIKQVVQLQSYEETYSDCEIVEYVMYYTVKFHWIRLLNDLLVNFTWSKQQLNTAIYELYETGFASQYSSDFDSIYEAEFDTDFKAIKVVKMLVNNGLTLSTSLLNKAVNMNDIEVVGYLLEKDAYSPYDLSKALTLACQKEYEILVRFMHSEGVTFEESCLENSNLNKYSFELLKFVLSNLKRPDKWYSKLLHQAIIHKDIQRMLYFHLFGGVINLHIPKTEKYGMETFDYFMNYDFQRYYKKIRPGCFTFVRTDDL